MLSRAAGKGKQSSWKGAKQRNSAKPRAWHCQPLSPAASGAPASSPHEWGVLQGRALGKPGDTFPFSCPQLTQPPARRAAASSRRAPFPGPQRQRPPRQCPPGLHFMRVPSRERHQAGGWRGPAGGWGCSNSEEPHLPLPLTARSLQHFAIHKQRQLQRESEGGRSPGAGWLLPSRRSLAPAPVPRLAFGRLRVPSDPVPC